MTSKEIVKKYIKFYEDRGHVQIPNVSLIPENDSTLLYVNSGMFPLVSYLSGQVKHPNGTRLVNIQRALRFFEDLDNIGKTNRHTTAFHMMGNWSLGDYFKEQQLSWTYEFIIETLNLDINKTYATVFEGDKSAPRDNESIEILKKIFKKYGIAAKEGERIFPLDKTNNWWQRGDAIGELGGPDSEIFYYIGNGTGIGKNPTEYQDEFVEIGNSVFMQYKKTAASWEELKQKNIDFGGGLERFALVIQNKKDIFETDNFWPIIEKIQDISIKNYEDSEKIKRSMRILADHIRSSTFLAMDGVIPSNKDQGYILRRLIRRMVRAGKILGIDKDISTKLVPITCNTFKWLYKELPSKSDTIEQLFSAEETKFAKTLHEGFKIIKKNLNLNKYTSLNARQLADEAFLMYQSIGYPEEIFLEDIKDFGVEIDANEFVKYFKNKLEEHQQESRIKSEQKFKGGLADHSDKVIKYHTVTHLLHSSIRDLLGNSVFQQGSNITNERLRFDFNYPTKLTDEQIHEIEQKVNTFIDNQLPVKQVILSKKDAEKTGALHFFGEKYADKVIIYYIGNFLQNAISKEFCGGPHVSNTKELKHINIYRQESLGSNKQRIYAKFII